MQFGRRSVAWSKRCWQSRSLARMELRKARESGSFRKTPKVDHSPTSPSPKKKSISKKVRTGRNKAAAPLHPGRPGADLALRTHRGVRGWGGVLVFSCGGPLFLYLILRRSVRSNRRARRGFVRCVTRGFPSRPSRAGRIWCRCYCAKKKGL